MSDFFEDQQAPNAEEDPAAAFLAREQDELAGLEDENDNAVTSIQPAESNDYDPFSGDADPETNLSEEPQQNGPSDAYSAISQVDRQRQEPEKIRIWREEQVIRIENKDEEEKTKIDELRIAAKKEMDDWYNLHDDQLHKTKDNNIAAEEAFIKERDEVVPGQDWERICRLCEFNPKNSKNTKDVSRFRSILLQLKQAPLVR